jgi:hypothetical protein
LELDGVVGLWLENISGISGGIALIKTLWNSSESLLHVLTFFPALIITNRSFDGSKNYSTTFHSFLTFSSRCYQTLVTKVIKTEQKLRGNSRELTNFFMETVNLS